MPRQITFRLTHDSGVLRIKLDCSLTLNEMKKSMIKIVKSKFPEEYEGVRIAISSSSAFKTAKDLKKDFMYKRVNAKKNISSLFKNGQKLFVVAEKKKIEEDPFAQEDPYADPYAEEDTDGFYSIDSDDNYGQEEEDVKDDENSIRLLVSSFKKKLKEFPDRTIVLRFRHPKGQSRMSVPLESSIDEIKSTLATDMLGILDIEDLAKLRTSVVLRDCKSGILNGNRTIGEFGLEDGARVIVECPNMNSARPGTPRIEPSKNDEGSPKDSTFLIKGNSIHIRLTHPNGKERVTVGTKNTLREFKTYLLSKLELKCPWDALKISRDKNVLSNPENVKLLSAFVSSGGGWSLFGKFLFLHSTRVHIFRMSK